MSPTTGTGIGLIVIGAILAFAVRDSLKGVDLAMIGYICLGAGALCSDPRTDHQRAGHAPHQCRRAPRRPALRPEAGR